MRPIEEFTICPALEHCYIARKISEDKMSVDRKILSDEEMETVIVWYAINRLKENDILKFTLGNKVINLTLNKL